MSRARHRRSFWVVLVGATGFMSIEPALFLVVLALALAALAVGSVAMLVSTLLADAVGHVRHGRLRQATMR